VFILLERFCKIDNLYKNEMNILYKVIKKMIFSDD